MTLHHLIDIDLLLSDLHTKWVLRAASRVKFV